MSDAIDRIESALMARYNVATLPDNLAEAVMAARSGDISRLDAAMEGRELYRWRAVVNEALAELHDPTPEPEGPTVTTAVDTIAEVEAEIGSPTSKVETGNAAAEEQPAPRRRR
jgi:hypothetical protein